MFNFGFAVEQVLGHVTHDQNLRHWVAQDSSIHPAWMPIRADVNDLWQRLPLVRTNWSLQGSLRARDAICSTLQTQPLDALFLHTQTIALFTLPFMQRIPTVISTDATPLNYDTIGAGYNHKVAGHSWLDRRKFLWNQRTYKEAAALVTWSEWAKASLVTDYGISADKIMVSPPGVDLEQWRSKSQLAGISSPPRLRLLFVGGDFTRKGGNTLLEAFLNGLQQSCILDIVTKDAKAIQDLAGIEGVQVHSNLTANSPRLKELYAQADVFVFPTRADCLPSVITEAMAAGLPIITTNVGAISEQVEAGVNGLLLPTDDVSALAAAITALVNDESKRHTMAVASRRFAEKRFNGQQNYGKILALMKQLTQERSERERSSSQSSFS